MEPARSKGARSRLRGRPGLYTLVSLDALMDQRTGSDPSPFARDAQRGGSRRGRGGEALLCIAGNRIPGLHPGPKCEFRRDDELRGSPGGLHFELDLDAISFAELLLETDRRNLGRFSFFE